MKTSAPTNKGRIGGSSTASHFALLCTWRTSSFSFVPISLTARSRSWRKRSRSESRRSIAVGQGDIEFLGHFHGVDVLAAAQVGEFFLSSSACSSASFFAHSLSYLLRCSAASDFAALV